MDNMDRMDRITCCPGACLEYDFGLAHLVHNVHFVHSVHSFHSLFHAYSAFARAPSFQRRKASMNMSMSPSRTRSVLEVSAPVRRSFTIW
jgi:hypothetical protein